MTVVRGGNDLVTAYHPVGETEGVEGQVGGGSSQTDLNKRLRRDARATAEMSAAAALDGPEPGSSTSAAPYLCERAPPDRATKPHAGHVCNLVAALRVD
jgi:hypothetical protein